ncbi:MAG TPA: peptidylprolyl isomerase [Burkholderiaceae bacterium]|nr:peptidylprolyl isomerase [Burkholderiaceae bacterium]
MRLFYPRLVGALVVGAGLALAAHAQQPAAKAARSSAPHVILATSAGDITLELDPEHAPRTVANFLQYVKAGHYDGTVFHRVIDNFMIQGGGYTADLTEKSTRPPIMLESSNGLENKRGTVAMARTNDPNSATAQFFINVADNAFLNYRKFDSDTTIETPRGPRLIKAGTVIDGYAVFGRVVTGMDVVDKIRGVKTGDQKGMQNVPVQPVLIKSAKIVP